MMGLWGKTILDFINILLLYINISVIYFSIDHIGSNDKFFLSNSVIHWCKKIYFNGELVKVYGFKYNLVQIEG